MRHPCLSKVAVPPHEVLQPCLHIARVPLRSSRTAQLVEAINVLRILPEHCCHLLCSKVPACYSMQVVLSAIHDAFYRLTDSRSQIQSYVFDVVRANKPKRCLAALRGFLFATTENNDMAVNPCCFYFPPGPCHSPQDDSGRCLHSEWHSCRGGCWSSEPFPQPAPC